MNILKLGKGSNFARKHKQTSSVRSVFCKLLLLQKMQIHYLLSWNHDINHGSYLVGFGVCKIARTNRQWRTALHRVRRHVDCNDSFGYVTSTCSRKQNTSCLIEFVLLINNINRIKIILS